MSPAADKWFTIFPRRRRRFWRYVSPGRRGAGAVVLALVVALVAGYLYLTNGQRIRRQAERVLSESIRGEVDIQSARFSLFGGIELEGVKMVSRTEGPQGQPRYEEFFQADEVLLRHDPFSLFTSGQLKPTHVLLIRPTVTYRQQASGESNATQLIGQADAEGGAGMAWAQQLPDVRVHDGTLRMLYVDADGNQSVRTVPLNVSMTRPQSDWIRLEFEDEPENPEVMPARTGSIAGVLEYNIRTGERRVSGEVPRIEGLDQLLPPNARKWRIRYKISGSVQWKSLPGPDGQEVLHAELSDASMQLPEQEGGLGLTQVRGRLIFDGEGVTVDQVTGVLPEAGQARFQLSGRFDGFQPESPYRLHVKVDGLHLPENPSGQGQVVDMIRSVRKWYNPVGPGDVDVELSRQQGQDLRIVGTVEPKGASITAAAFPYRVDDVTGKIVFKGTTAELVNLKGRRGDLRASLSGTVGDIVTGNVYDVTVEVTDAPLDKELREAMQPQWREIWDALRPEGQASARVIVRRGPDDERESVDLHLMFNRRTSLEYEGFPYRLDKVEGDVHVTDRTVAIRRLQGRSGAMRATIDGRIENIAAPKEIRSRIKVVARSVPIDAKLMSAVDPKARQFLQSLRCTGVADVSANVSTRGADEADFRVVADVRELAMQPVKFPLKVTDAAGRLIITPERINVERLVGMHGTSEVSLTGTVHITGEQPGVDLHAKATQLAFTREIRSLLNAGSRSLWDALQPRGLADVDVVYRHNLTDEDGRPLEEDFLVTVRPKKLAVTYEYFPYTFLAVGGEARIGPESVVLDRLLARQGGGTVELSGSIDADENADVADLSVKARSVPVDKALLAAMPEQMAPITERIKPGGTISLDLSKLSFEVRDAEQPATAPAEATTRATARTRPVARRVNWMLVGTVGFDSVQADVGFGEKTITGEVAGTAVGRGGKVSLDAEMSLKEVHVGKARLTNLKGTLRKGPQSDTLVFRDLVADAHEGKLDGFAEMKLGEEFAFGLNLTVAGAQLNSLVNAGVDDPKKKVSVEGELTGVLKMRFIDGKRRATGRVRIAKAKMYKLPVLMGLLHVVYLTLPGDSAFNEGYLTYELDGDTLTVKEIYLTGSALSLLGSGTVDLDSERIKLTFLSGPPGKVPRMDGLGGLVAEINRELVEIRIGGTLSKPSEPKTVPLRSLDAMIRTLLDPGNKPE